MDQGNEHIDVERLRELLEDQGRQLEEQQRQMMQEYEGLESSTDTESSRKDRQGQESRDMLWSKLNLQSQIEALVKTPLLALPEDPELFLYLAKEEMELEVVANERTLAVYKNKVAEVRKEKQKYKEMVQRASLVKTKLDNIIANEQKKDRSDIIRRRYEWGAVRFKSLRSELHSIISDLYPSEGEGCGVSLEDLLDRLVTKLLTEPNNPYIEIEEDMQGPHIAGLLQANLITRHPSEVSKIKFIDPRN